MTPKALDSLYPTLTPEERVALTLAAQARGDIDELARLMRTAPRVTIQRPHHRTFSLNLERIAFFYVTLQFPLIVQMHGDSAVLENSEKNNRPPPYAPETTDVAVYALGWRRFCERYGINPDEAANEVPGYAVVRAYDECCKARMVDSTPDEIERRANEFCTALVNRVETVDF